VAAARRSNVDAELVKITQTLEKSLRDLYFAMKNDKSVQKTVIIHPQLGSSSEEAKELSESWDSKEFKQALENLKRSIG
jgi:hypothetical protein